jgi:CelD/BcsL family acetyltransferase involved in cellulose biosynthesis
MIVKETIRTRVRIASSIDALEGIEDDWLHLAEAQGNAFVTPDWFHTWLRHYGSTAEPAVAAVHGDDDSLLGLLPLVTTRHRSHSILRFAGANVGDCFHPVAVPGHEAAVAGAAWEALSASSRTPTMILENAEGSGGWIDRLGSGRPGIFVTRYRPAPLPYARIPREGWDRYLATRSRNFRSQVHRKRRKLERDHRLSFRRTRTQAELEQDFEVLFELHEARWGDRGGSTALTEGSRAFHRDFARIALARGWLRLSFLELEGKPVAALYGWRLGPRYSYYMSGFSPRRSRDSVGFVLLAHTIQSACEEQASEYDLLLGDEDYKHRFDTDARTVQTIALGPRTDPAAIRLRFDAALWRAGRRLSPSLRARAASAYRRISLISKR